MPPTHVSLFIPCMIDQVYPQMGVAMVRILRRLGITARYNREQTCCGQPAFNAGHRTDARTVARKFVKDFRKSGETVGLSGSCAAMVRNFYPVLFEGDPDEADAVDLGSRLFEFGEYLHRIGVVDALKGRWTAGPVGFHNSCHSLRELGLALEPFNILERIEDLEVRQPAGDPVCCGFGGVFSVKFAPVADTMAKTRLEQFLNLGVETLVSNDPGCILNLQHEAKDAGHKLRIIHLVELLDEAMANLE